jgi:hypothetical protein
MHTASMDSARSRALNASPRRETTASRAPSRANRRVAANPTPELAPVISTRRPTSRGSRWRRRNIIWSYPARVDATVHDGQIVAPPELWGHESGRWSPPRRRSASGVSEAAKGLWLRRRPGGLDRRGRGHLGALAVGPPRRSRLSPSSDKVSFGGAPAFACPAPEHVLQPPGDAVGERHHDQARRRKTGRRVLSGLPLASRVHAGLVGKWRSRRTSRRGCCLSV